MQVTVHRDKMVFPPFCSKCIKGVNLTSFIADWKTTYLGEEFRTKVTRSAYVEIPICQSCKKAVIKKERTTSAIMFAVLTPLTWGIALLAGIVPLVGEAVLSFFGSNILTNILGIVWLILFLVPGGALMSIKNPYKDAKWPVKLEKSKFIPYDSDSAPLPNIHTFSFENGRYARLFLAANPGYSYLEDKNFDNLKSKDGYVRGKTVMALGESKDPEAVEPLIQTLKDEYWVVRRNAAEALGKLMDPKAVEPLIQTLKDESKNVRGEAAIALGKIGDTRALEALTEAEKDKSRWVRGSAAKAFEEIKRTAKEKHET